MAKWAMFTLALIGRLGTRQRRWDSRRRVNDVRIVVNSVVVDYVKRFKKFERKLQPGTMVGRDVFPVFVAGDGEG